MTARPVLHWRNGVVALGVLLVIVGAALLACLSWGCAQTARTTISPATTTLGATTTRTTILAEPAAAPSEQLIRIRVIGDHHANPVPPAAPVRPVPGPDPAHDRKGD